MADLLHPMPRTASARPAGSPLRTPVADGRTLLLDIVPSRFDEELGRVVADLGERPYRVRQVRDWVYRRLATSFDEMSDLPAALRRALGDRFVLTSLATAERAVSRDGTEKFIWLLGDGREVESVSIPTPRKLTFCISSQVGCPLACSFCATGKLGYTRQLTAGEIVDQVRAMLRLTPGAERSTGETQPGRKKREGQEELAGGRESAKLEDRDQSVKLVGRDESGELEGRRDPAELEDRHDLAKRKHARVREPNLVFMGMGEPLLNLRNLLPALESLNAEPFLGIGARRITVSTSGVVPRITDLAAFNPQIKLAISLHAPEDALRDVLVPLNRKYPLARLMEACREFAHTTGKRITFEYIHLPGVNDLPEHPALLRRLLGALPAKINLIPYNPVPGLSYRPPAEAESEAFLRRLRSALRCSVTLRRPRGRDIGGACGQLELERHPERIASPLPLVQPE